MKRYVLWIAAVYALLLMMPLPLLGIANSEGDSPPASSVPEQPEENSSGAQNPAGAEGEVFRLLDSDTGEVYGKAVYQIQNASGQMQSVRFQMQPGYRVSSVSANGKAVPYSLGSEVTNNIRELTVELPNEPEIELSIEYGGLPQDWNIMSTMQGGPEISHQYMCLENQVLSPAPLDFAA